MVVKVWIWNMMSHIYFSWEKCTQTALNWTNFNCQTFHFQVSSWLGSWKDDFGKTNTKCRKQKFCLQANLKMAPQSLMSLVLSFTTCTRYSFNRSHLMWNYILTWPGHSLRSNCAPVPLGLFLVFGAPPTTCVPYIKASRMLAVGVLKSCEPDFDGYETISQSGKNAPASIRGSWCCDKTLPNIPKQMYTRGRFDVASVSGTGH